MSVIFTTPIGRLVSGHPMKQNVVTDKVTKLPKMQADGVTPATRSFAAIAIAKTPGVDWKQEPWGLLIVGAANVGWVNGESLRPDFAWKVTDGDSKIPGKPFNGKPGRIPAEREGFPGHWILNCSTGLGIKCFHALQYDPSQQIQDKNEIKPGDYCRIQIDCKANTGESPGVYLNPNQFELSRAGQQIDLGDGPSAEEAFGAAAGVLPAGAQVDTAVATAPGPGAPPVPGPGAPPITAAPDFLNGGAPAPAAEVMYTIPAGTQHMKAALLTAGWQAAAVDALPNNSAAVAAAALAPPANNAPLPPVLYTIPAGTQHTKEALLTAGWLEPQVDALPNDGISY